MSEDALAIDRRIARQLPVCWPVFFEKWGRLTPIQRLATDPIQAGKDTLVSASTASGKTESVCAPLLERLIATYGPWTILYVSPTRALVNDLYARLSEPLHRLGIRLQRRTGEYKDTDMGDHRVIITTPESMDSMLCRGRLGDDGHRLQHVRAVILDEIHLLAGGARGQQLSGLLLRLRRLQSDLHSRGLLGYAGFQTVALSATLPDPRGVMEAFLGSNSEWVHAAGGREIEEVTVPGLEDLSVVGQLPVYLGSISQPEKVLVFADTRKRVDELSAVLGETLDSMGYQVRAHHGSLSQKVRESTEAAAHRLERIVVVATSTLEIGIDIGDIDLVVLDGPPKSLSSMLQRIGRGNRRTNKTRVMMCSRSESDRLVNRAMLHCAREGFLGPAEHAANSAVARQQVASYIYQSPKTWRSKAKLIDLIECHLGAQRAESLIDEMIRNGELERDVEDRLSLGEMWADKAYNGKIHSNIEGTLGSSIVDEATGKVIATGVKYGDESHISVAGRGYRVSGFDGNTIRVEARGGAGTAVSYASGRYRYGANWGAALRRYLKIPEDVWPVVPFREFVCVLHFGGATTKLTLDQYSRIYGDNSLIKSTQLCLAFSSGWDGDKPEWLMDRQIDLTTQLSDELGTLENVLGLPLANQHLPLDVRLYDVQQALDFEKEMEWISASRWVSMPDLMEISGLEDLLSDELGRL